MKNSLLKITVILLAALMILSGCAHAPADVTTEKPGILTEAPSSEASVTAADQTEPPATEPAGADTEPYSETAAVPTEAQTTEKATETEKQTETEPAPTETEPATEPPTEPVTEKQTEKVTEKVTERVTEPVTERQTEPATEPATDPVTEPATEPVTEPVTDEPDPTPTILPHMPNKSTTLSYEFALTLLDFASGGGETATASRLKSAGLTHIYSGNYTKPSDDTSHTCAYVVAKGDRNGKEVYVVVIRGTSGGEWVSNFDFAPSHDNDTQYAENFLYCAQDIFDHIKTYLNKSSDSQIVVCGHSRGAAAANLLGVLLDREYGKDRVYAYTFATPTTVRGAAAEIKYDNIFNFINPDDVVTYMPPAEYGYKRAGIDIILPTSGANQDVIEGLSNVASIVPDIKSYYENRYSLTGPGLSEDGSTVYELFIGVVAGIADGSYNIEIPTIMPTSDLYPFMELFYRFYKIKTMLSVRAAHEPDTYETLIKQIM